LIPSKTIKAFIEQPRRDLRDFKKLTRKDLEDEIDKLPIDPPIWEKLSFRQKVCFVIGAKFRRFAAFLDTGEGKTLLSIALIRYCYRAKYGNKALVLVPYKVNKNEWREEILKHSPKTTYLVLSETSDLKWRDIEENDDVIIVIETYAGLARLVSEKVYSKKHKRTVLKPSYELVKKLVNTFDMLVMDESNAVANHMTLPFRVCRQLSKKAGLVLALTGTPFGRNPMALWGQMFIVDFGQSLGKTLGVFRATFFKESVNYWGGIDYKFDRKKMPLLHKMLAHSAIRYEADKRKMPEAVEITKYVTLPGDAQTYYDRAKETIISAHGNYKEMQNAFIRMRQISSGFIGYEDDESGESAKFVFDEKPKLELLLSTIESLSHKAVIFHDFVFSGQLIHKELKRMKIKHIYLPNVKDSESVSKMFADDPDSHLVMSTAGAYGLNLQPAKYLLFYERPVPVILYTQVRRRVERQYSPHDIVYLYDFVTRNTTDEKIIEFHKEGKSLFEGIINGQVSPKIFL